MRRAMGVVTSAAGHVLAFWVLQSTPAIEHSRTPGKAMATFIVAPTEDPTYPGLEPRTTKQDLGALDSSSADSSGRFDFDASKIAARADVLFPFLTPGLSFENMGLAPSRASRHLVFAFGTAADAETDRPRPGLSIGDAELQGVIDRAWSRRDRWAAFGEIAALANRYDADSGALPRVFQAYQQQNWLQPYADAAPGVRDPRLWAELGLAADHVAFVGFISRYATAHPSTRATIELLFLLDKVVQAGYDALASLVDTSSDALEWTRERSPGAHALAGRLHQRYAGELARKGLTSAEQLQTFVEGVRLMLLKGILQTTPRGYRAADARFLTGSILWRQKQRREALLEWRDIRPDPSDTYFKAYSDILAAIADAPDSQANRSELATRIDGAMNAERGRWLMFSLDRLHAFGFRFDRF